MISNRIMIQQMILLLFLFFSSSSSCFASSCFASSDFSFFDWVFASGSWRFLFFSSGSFETSSTAASSDLLASWRLAFLAALSSCVVAEETCATPGVDGGPLFGLRLARLLASRSPSEEFPLVEITSRSEEFVRLQEVLSLLSLRDLLEPVVACAPGVMSSTLSLLLLRLALRLASRSWLEEAKDSPLRDLDFVRSLLLDSRDLPESLAAAPSGVERDDEVSSRRRRELPDDYSLILEVEDISFDGLDEQQTVEPEEGWWLCNQ